MSTDKPEPRGRPDGKDATSTGGAPDPADPDGLAALVDDMEARITGDGPAADTSAGGDSEPEPTQPSAAEDKPADGPEIGEQDLDLDDLTGAGGSPTPAEPPA